MDEDRIIDEADTILFNALKKYASEVPMIVIGTKKDTFMYQCKGRVREFFDVSIYADREAFNPGFNRRHM